MSKKTKTILIIVSAIIAVAACVAAILYYQEEIKAFIANIREKVAKKESGYTEEELEDFADI